jgi:GNAT superfamily N-acetyltransferase
MFSMKSDPIFDTFRDDYPGFDAWLRKCKLEQRVTWIIRDEGNASYSAICIIKREDGALGAEGRTLKVCSLKVSEERQGRRYGELLLKTLFLYLAANTYEHAFITVFERHGGLITLLEDFGFTRAEPNTSLGERVYVKRLRASIDERRDREPLDFHVHFGPPAIKIVPGSLFVVPIQPRFHRLPFPDAEATSDVGAQLRLPIALPPLEPQPFGNAIRKAYVSNSPTRRCTEGATLLFYRSHDQQAVTAIGVVEDTLVSKDAAEVASFVGQRTVYSLEQLVSICSRGQALAIRFRQDRLLPTPIPRDELVSHEVFRRPPQSIVSVPPEVIPWLESRIGG